MPVKLDTDLQTDNRTDLSAKNVGNSGSNNDVQNQANSSIDA